MERDIKFILLMVWLLGVKRFGIYFILKCKLLLGIIILLNLFI